MGEKAIRVAGLGKEYQIGEPDAPTSLREAVGNVLRSPFRGLGRRLRGEPAGERFWALKDVSFEVEPGEVVGIIGRNGAGKSTLLKVLSQITEPTTGEVELNGRVSSLLEVGTGFHAELTGRENIFLNGSILGMSRAEIKRKFDEIVAFSEVDKFIDTPVKRYSSGMYVRLAFAVAAHLDPEVLIIDEVLAVGDAAFQKKCLGKMGEVARGGRTVLFVSHNVGAVRALCSSGCLLARGQLAYSGPIDECVNRYLHTEAYGDRSWYKTAGPTEDKHCWVRSAEVLSATDGLQPVGGRLVVRVEAEFRHPTRHPRLGFVLSTGAGESVLNSNNTYLPFTNPSEPVRSGVFMCDFGEVPILPGVYSISLWLGDERGDHDVLHDCLRFKVKEGDVWGTGRQPPRNAGVMYWRTQFSFEGSADEVSGGC